MNINQRRPAARLFTINLIILLTCIHTCVDLFFDTDLVWIKLLTFYVPYSNVVLKLSVYCALLHTISTNPRGVKLTIFQTKATDNETALPYGKKNVC